MASELGLPPPPAKPPPTAPTTITDIGDDLLCEIFLLLPSLPSLVRAAISCRTFLHAVRSSPAIRHRFKVLHPPQILGFFIEPCCPAIPTFAPLRRRSDPDLTAVVRGADFLLTRIPEDNADSTPGWEVQNCHGGYVVLVNETTSQIAAYNPVTQALDIIPLPYEDFLEFHIVISEENPGVFRMVGIRHRDTSRQVPACIVVFSSTTREWKVFPWVETPQPEDDVAPPPPLPPQPEDDGDDMLTFYDGKQLNGLVYWRHTSQAYLLVLNTVTLQFVRMDLPVFGGEIDSSLFCLGQTKDGKLCMVGADDSDAETKTIVVWFRRADDDAVEKWMLEKTFPMGTFIDVTKGNATAEVKAVIDGFVYLSAMYAEQPESLRVLSLCLETAKMSKLYNDTYPSPAYPYIMVWPPSLVCNKASLCLKIPEEDSQTMVTEVSVADVGPVGTKESPSVLDVKNSLASKVTVKFHKNRERSCI